MAAKGRYLFIGSMDVTPEKEALFNEVYDQEHIPALLKVPGVLSVTRAQRVPAAVMIGGERKPLDGAGEPAFTAIYELESPDVLTSPAWQEQVEQGRWPTEVRPYTSNRRHVVRKVI